MIKGPILSDGVMGRGCREQPGPDITQPRAPSSVLRAPEGHRGVEAVTVVEVVEPVNFVTTTSGF